VHGLRIATLLCLGVSLLPAQELRDYDRKVTEFTLSNGLHFILLERHQVPVVSFHTYVNAGSAQEPSGQTGLATLLSRLAFEGTETIGSKDWPAEKKALEDLETAYDRVQEERNKGPRASAGTLAALEAVATAALNNAREFENPGEFDRVLQENGAVRVNSHATPDSIEVSYSLPSNRIELWFLLESQRLAHPVFRGFYRERQNMIGESAAAESKPLPRVRQSLLTAAFEESPYRNPLLGWPSDVASLRVADLKAFLDTYAGPGNTVISIVGDVDPANARTLAERYFGTIPAKPHPPLPHVQEPRQLGPKNVTVWGEAQPVVMVGYKRPAETDRDDAALDFIQMILGDAQTGWMRKSLVDEKRIAQEVDAVASFPSARFVNLFVLTATPAADHTVDENRQALDELVVRLQSQPVDAETLGRVKNVLRSRLARILGNNQRLAGLLPLFYERYGDWRRLFSLASQYDRMTAADLQQVALLYLTPAVRTAVSLAPNQGASSSPAGGQQ
jgi:predicted Zn-dependent peptidase